MNNDELITPPLSVGWYTFEIKWKRNLRRNILLTGDED